LRLKYATWDALQEIDATFHLPPHLARTFSVEQITARDFAARWETVCEEQDALRIAIKNCQSPRDLMAFLATRDASWNEHLNEYSQAREAIRSLRERTRVLEAEVTALRNEARGLHEQASNVERVKGEDWRQTVQPLRQRLFDLKEGAAQRVLANAGKKLSKEERAAQAQLETAEEQEIAELRERIAWCIKERAHFDEEIGAARQRAHELRTQARSKTHERVTLEKSEAARQAREVIARLEYEAEWQRFQLVRDALVTSRGLHHTNYRPTAWWFPLISPDGKWLDRLANTAQARIEEL
jgi:chromosome segregation ATPase